MAIGQNAIDIVINARDRFSATFKKANLSMQSFQKSALAMGAIGGIIAFGLKGAVDASIELETAMVGVRKTTGMTADEIAGLRTEFIEMSKVLPVSATELAQIGEVAGQLGIQGVDNIKSFTEVAAKMSIATELSAENAALALAKISNAMGFPIEKAENLASTINELSNISAASSTEIISAMTRVAGSAKTLGLSTDVVAGLSSALIAAGEPAERAGTKLRSAFDSIVKKMDEVVEFMPGFKDAFAVDANQAILSLITEISKIEDPLERQKQAMDIFGTVGASAINKLSNNLPEMNRLLDAAGKEIQSTTSLNEEVAIAIGSTANQINLAKNAFTAIQLEIAEVLKPTLDALIGTITNIFDWFVKLPGPVKQAIIIFAAVTAAVFILAAAIALLTLAASPWLLILLGISATIAAVIILFRNWEEIGWKVKAILWLIAAPIMFLITVIKNWRVIFSSMWKFMLKGGTELLLFWQRFGDVWKLIWTGVKNAFIFVWNSIVGYFEDSINSIVDKINTTIEFMNKVPGVNIPLVPTVDFSAVKGEMTDMGALTAEIEANRVERRVAAEADLARMNIHIDNVYGIDADDVSEALQDKLDQQIST